VTRETAARPWGETLAHLTPWDVECRRRGGAAAERLRAWGPRLREALPEAIAGLWPFASADAWEMTVALERSGGSRHELRLDAFPLRIGRAGGCALQLPDPQVSSEHAEIQVEGGAALVMDLRSTNGTRRNGEPLTPLTPVALEPGDRLEMGPFALTLLHLARAGLDPAAIELRASSPRLRAADDAFLGAHPTDRWASVRWAGETALLKVSAPWMRACWRRAADAGDEPVEVSPLEEGAAQFVLTQAAYALGDRLGTPVELGGWLSTAEARRLFAGEALWLASDVWIRASSTEVPLSVLVPAGEAPPPAGLEAWGGLQWPVSVCLGLLTLRVGDWSRVEPGDALLPDVWWAGERLPAAGEWGAAWLRVSSTWHGGRFLLSQTGAKLRLESPWRSTPGGGRPMSDEEVRPAEPAALDVHDLELLVAVELDRFPITLAELQRWRPGEVVNLRRGPSDTVSLVVETGAQRRVLAEGRVVVVGDRLGIEVLRLLTRIEDGPAQP
jgi:flagellar motor switch/type III secretory pathway protein FliN